MDVGYEKKVKEEGKGSRERHSKNLQSGNHHKNKCKLNQSQQYLCNLAGSKTGSNWKNSVSHIKTNPAQNHSCQQGSSENVPSVLSNLLPYIYKVKDSLSPELVFSGSTRSADCVTLNKLLRSTIFKVTKLNRFQS